MGPQLAKLLHEAEVASAQLVEMAWPERIQGAAQTRLVSKGWALPGGSQHPIRSQARVHLGETATARQDRHHDILQFRRHAVVICFHVKRQGGPHGVEHLPACETIAEHS